MAFSSAPSISLTKGSCRASFLLAVGVVGDDPHDLAVALGKHPRAHVGDVLVPFQLFADPLRRFGDIFSRCPWIMLDTVVVDTPIDSAICLIVIGPPLCYAFNLS
jgi:hypothetical protein